MIVNYPQIAAAVYQVCTTYDQYLPQLSADVASSWAKVFAYYNLSAEDLLAGADAVYREQGRGYRPLPADIAKAARAVRDDRTARSDDTYSVREQRIDAKLAQHISEVVAAKGIPGDDELRFARPTFNPLRVPCGFCKANVGWPCVDAYTKRRKGGYHPSRMEAAKASA